MFPQSSISLDTVSSCSNPDHFHFKPWNFDKTSSKLPSFLRGPTAGHPKFPPRSNMPSPLTPESNPSQGEPPIFSPSRTLAPQANNQRWRFNGTGQLVDADAASPEWDIADEIG